MQKLVLDHNTRIAKLSTRLAQLHDQLNNLQKQESMKEQRFINQSDTKRLNVFLLLLFHFIFIVYFLIDDCY